MLGPGSFPIPDLPEPIRAYRYLRLAGDDETPILISQFDKTVWPTRTRRTHDFVTAVCASEEELPPHLSPTDPADDVVHAAGSGCGLYAYKEIQDLAWDWPLTGVENSARKLGVWGKKLGVWVEVSLWGRVFEHDRGYRAQYARIENVIHIDGISSMTFELKEWIAETYGVPVVRHDPALRKEINAYIHERLNPIHVPLTFGAACDKLAAGFKELAEALVNLVKGQ